MNYGEALAQCPFIEHFEMEKRHILSEGFKGNLL